jgi:hypothetical protein
MKEFTWTTRSGQKLKLPEIENGHLLNIYGYLTRQLYELRDLQMFSYSPFAPQGEMALESLDQAIEESYEEEDKLSRTRDVIAKEIRARKMPIPHIPYKNEWADLTDRIEYIEEGAFNQHNGMGIGRLIKLK